MIGQRILEVRKTLNLSQEEFGKRISMAKSSISLIESNSREANDRVIQLIIREFNVNEDWLRSGEGMMFSENEDELIDFFVQKLDTFTEFDHKFLTSYLKLSKDERKAIEKLILGIQKNGGLI